MILGGTPAFLVVEEKGASLTVSDLQGQIDHALEDVSLLPVVSSMAS